MEVLVKRGHPFVYGVLLGFFEAAGDVLEALADPYSLETPFRMGMPRFVYEENRRFIEEARQRRAIRALERKRHIECLEIQDKFFWKLTAAGFVQVLKSKIKTAADLPGGRCIVSYDIPESARHARNALRHFLKSAGFIPIHKSVFVSFKDVAADCITLFRLLGIDEWTWVAVSW